MKLTFHKTLIYGHDNNDDDNDGVDESNEVILQLMWCYTCCGITNANGKVYTD